MSLVEVEVADRVATVTLNRPEALNAISTELATALAEAVEPLATDLRVRAVVQRLWPYLATSVNWREPNRRGLPACRAWCNREDLRCSRKTISMALSTFVLLSRIDPASLAISVKRLALLE